MTSNRPARAPLTITVAVAGVAATGVVDHVTGYEVRLFPLYFFPVALVAWRLSRAATIVVAALSAVVWVVSNSVENVHASPAILAFNSVSQFVAFATVGLLVNELRRRLASEQGLSRQDTLTRLANTRAFYERGEQLVAVARRSGRPLTLAYLDLDAFKRLNDEHGHKEGDRALTVTADVLRQQLRTSDLCARLGGDEFAILMPDTGLEAATASLERVRNEVSIRMRSESWPVTVSIGAVVYARAPSTLERAVRDADELMYRAKDRGKDRLHIEASDDGGATGSNEKRAVDA